MPEDLPIYSESQTLRSGLQFVDLLRWKNVDTSAIWAKSDGFIALMEGAKSVAEARSELTVPGKDTLLRTHGILFKGESAAGRLRESGIAGRYRGQDCPDPEFLDRSLDNFFTWMNAESIAEIHPIEKAALALTRIVDVWPFAIGNLTTAVILANAYLKQSGLAPFFVLPEHMPEFDKIVAQAVTIETQPLVNAIHQTIKREMEGLVS